VVGRLTGSNRRGLIQDRRGAITTRVQGRFSRFTRQKMSIGFLHVTTAHDGFCRAGRRGLKKGDHRGEL
jgi:hypothetical protein